MDRIDEELYFLILRFLQNGPCREAASVLAREVVRHELLPKRIDWEGKSYPHSFDELVSTHPHIGADHLKHISSRLPGLLDEKFTPAVSGVQSLLGAGTQSLLRTEKTSDARLSVSSYLSRQNGVVPKLAANITNKPTFVQSLIGREYTSVLPRIETISPHALYSHYGLQRRFLGHLSSVYCVLYDRTGQYIFTGADDNLVKVWSALSGRLLATLRGHSGEITDLSINHENQILASGSCDKSVRIWCLASRACLAILSGHTAMVTSIQFCPLVRGDIRYLVSTGEDGNVCFWHYTTKDMIFEKKPVKFIERSRASAKMLCLSFSPGGLFLTTGNSDSVIRVYCLIGLAPEKIGELEAHTDVVDSIQYSNLGDRFVSGSSDGTARIWRYMRKEWLNLVLNMNNESSDNKLKVSMVAWSSDDKFVLTAVSDFSIKIWCSNTGKLVKQLVGHEDEVFVLECSPHDHRLLLTGAHDGHVKLWDMNTCTELMDYYNNIDGQGYGAVFDCKWSPRGHSFVATDSHGHLMYFGHGVNEKLTEDKIPTELYFHTDYRTLLRDSNDHVLDEQTQRAVHLLPPPFLVDIDGVPYPPIYQRLVPGREKLTDEHLIPRVLDMPNGTREVQDQELPTPAVEDGPSQSTSQTSSHCAATSQPSTPTTSQQPTSSSDTQLSGSPLQVKEPKPLKNCMIHPMKPCEIELSQVQRRLITEREQSDFISEEKKHPFREDEHMSSGSFDQPVYLRTRKRKPQSYRTRATRRQEQRQSGEQAVRNRLTTRALYDTDYEEDPEDEGEEMSAGSRGASSSPRRESFSSSDDSDDSVHPSRPANSDDTSDYSDWEQDTRSNLQPPSRRMTRRIVPPRALSPDNDTPVRRKSTEANRTKRAKKRAKKVVDQFDQSAENASAEDLERTRPPDWLTTDQPRRAPYFPQMGDEVMYFHQGHRAYINEVCRLNLYTIPLNKRTPMNSIPNLRDTELMMVKGIKFEIMVTENSIIRLCCLKLVRILDSDTSADDKKCITFKYHDMPGVIDFLVLRQFYDQATRRNWNINDRFRSVIDDKWWTGEILSYEPYDPEAPDCQFQCYKVEWDGGGEEKMSPWDLEPLPDSGEDVLPEAEITEDEMQSLQYVPNESEWPNNYRDAECDRISRCFEEAMGHSKAEAFAAPVDLNEHYGYALTIAYPMDLSTIKARLDSRFYRRVAQIHFDIRHIAQNAELFNKPRSKIVSDARIIAELCQSIVSDTTCVDAQSVYHNMDLDSDYYAEDSPGASKSISKKKRNRSSPPGYDWMSACKKLVEECFQLEDAVPFRYPVDILDYPDYQQKITTPMDLTSILENMAEYESPQEVLKDVQLIFTNSKAYNTNKRSKVFGMTVRLSARLVDELQTIIKTLRNSISSVPSTSGSRKRKHSSLSLSEHADDDQDEPVSPKRHSRRLQTLRERHNLEQWDAPLASSSSHDGQRSSRRLRRRVRTKYFSEMSNLSSPATEPGSFVHIQKKSRRLGESSDDAAEAQEVEIEEVSPIVTKGNQKRTVIASISEEEEEDEEADQVSDYDKETDQEEGEESEHGSTDNESTDERSTDCENHVTPELVTRKCKTQYGTKRKLKQSNKRYTGIAKASRSSQSHNGWSSSRFRARTGASNYCEDNSDTEDEEVTPCVPLVSSRGRLRKPTSKAREGWR